MLILIEMPCINCDESLYHSLYTSETVDGSPVVPAHIVEQTEWPCQSCGHTTATGDLDAVDTEDL